MKFAEDDPSKGYFISAYDETGVSINGERYETSLVIAPDALQTEWPPGAIDELCSEHFQSIIELRPELVLLGTGPNLRFPPVETYAALIQAGIGVEIMDTGAACRTYNILVSESRRVVAGLIL